MKAATILDTIGDTPHVRINHLYGKGAEVWMKLERANPGGSIKDRIALSMVEDAERRGLLKRGSTVIEPTSGNTGIGLAIVCAVKHYRLILVMPESMSIERRRLMAAHGATFELTPRELGMKGAIQRAQELAKEIPDSWMPMQFENAANIEIHKTATAQEILRDFPEGLDALITGVGTGGHLTGCAEVLKRQVAGAESLCRRTGAVASHQRWPARAAPHPGDRGRVHPGQSPPRSARRGHHRHQRRGFRLRRPGGSRGGHLRRYLLRGIPCGGCQEAPRARSRVTRSHLLLRYGRALPLCRRSVPIGDDAWESEANGDHCSGWCRPRPGRHRHPCGGSPGSTDLLPESVLGRRS